MSKNKLNNTEYMIQLLDLVIDSLTDLKSELKKNSINETRWNFEPMLIFKNQLEDIQSKTKDQLKRLEKALGSS